MRPVPKYQYRFTLAQDRSGSAVAASFAKTLSSDISIRCAESVEQEWRRPWCALVQEQMGRIGDPRRAAGSVSKAWGLAQKRGCPWRICASASNKKYGRARRRRDDSSAREFPTRRTAGMVAVGSSFCHHLTPDGRACLLPPSYLKRQAGFQFAYMYCRKPFEGSWPWFSSSIFTPSINIF